LIFREDVVARRTAFCFAKARERSHILCGLAVAVTTSTQGRRDNPILCGSAEAREKLMTRRWPAEQILQYIARSTIRHIRPTRIGTRTF